MSLTPITLPIKAPVGAGFERVSKTDTRLINHPLVIVGSVNISAESIYRKYTDYRIWHTLNATIESDLIPIEDGSGFADVIQDLFQQCEDNDPDYAEGVDLIGVIYPKADESKVTQWLSKFPPALPLAVSSHRDGLPPVVDSRNGQKSVHVRGRNGTKSLAIAQQRLDIEVQKSRIFTFLNSSSDPNWAIFAQEEGLPQYAYTSEQPRMLSETEASELAAWQKVKLWLKAALISVQQDQRYPEGKNAFPDFRAWIGDQEYDIEMTSVPDLEKWTIRGKYRDLEKKICQVAAQPSETQKEVVDKLHEVVDSKVRRACASTRRFMLVVSNWSTQELGDKALWPTGHFSEIDIVLLIDINEVRCIKWGDWMNE